MIFFIYTKQHQQQKQQQQRQQQQSEMLSMMMMSGHQRPVGISPVPQDVQMLLNNGPSSRDLLQRPEAQAIIQGLQQGEITRAHIQHQLQVRQSTYFVRLKKIYYKKRLMLKFALV